MGGSEGVSLQGRFIALSRQIPLRNVNVITSTGVREMGWGWVDQQGGVIIAMSGDSVSVQR